MLRLSKRIEYGLLAVQYIAVRRGEIVRAKEIAEWYGISFELVAKVLHALSKSRITVSHQGTQGGYTLARTADLITIADVITGVEGKQNIVDCAVNDIDCCCVAFNNCTIRKPMQALQKRIDALFHSMTIAETISYSAETISV